MNEDDELRAVFVEEAQDVLLAGAQRAADIGRDAATAAALEMLDDMRRVPA